MSNWEPSMPVLPITKDYGETSDTSREINGNNMILPRWIFDRLTGDVWFPLLLWIMTSRFSRRMIDVSVRSVSPSQFNKTYSYTLIDCVVNWVELQQPIINHQKSTSLLNPWFRIRWNGPFLLASVLQRIRALLLCQTPRRTTSWRVAAG
jgi:hypothetical protein